MIEKILVRSVSESSMPSVSLQLIYDNNGETSAENKVFSFFREIYGELPLKDKELTEEEYDTIAHAAEVTAAVKKGLNLLSFSSNSEAMLAVKLRRRGVSADVAEEAAAFLSRHGYINETGDAKREVERCLRKHWGLSRIVAHLKSKGYDEQTVNDIETDLENEDFSEHCAKLIEVNYDEIPEDPHERRKLIASLARHGYTMSEIEAGIKLFKHYAV